MLYQFKKTISPHHICFTHNIVPHSLIPFRNSSFMENQIHKSDRLIIVAPQILCRFIPPIRFLHLIIFEFISSQLRQIPFIGIRNQTVNRRFKRRTRQTIRSTSVIHNIIQKTGHGLFDTLQVIHRNHVLWCHIQKIATGSYSGNQQNTPYRSKFFHNLHLLKT